MASSSIALQPENRHIFFWNITMRTSTAEYTIYSNAFPLRNGSSRYQFQMSMGRENYYHKDDCYVSFLRFLLHRTDGGRDHLRAKYRLSILDYDGNEHCVMGGIAKFIPGLEQDDVQNNLVSYDYLFDRQNGLSHGERKFKVRCEVEVPNWNQAVQIVQQPTPLPLTQPTPKSYAIKAGSATEEPSKLAKDLGCLLQNSKHCDVVIVIGDKEYAAHKAILIARSPVFATMFDAEFKEKMQCKVEITDLDAGAGAELLRYMYTDKVANMDEHALELLGAAEKYQLDSLKTACERHISAKLATESVCHILLIADLYRAPRLKEKCIDYIIDHSQEVMATEGWKAVTLNSQLVTILFQKLSLKK